MMMMKCPRCEEQQEIEANLVFDLDSALTVLQTRKGEGLALTSEEAKNVYGSVWRVEAMLADAELIHQESEWEPLSGRATVEKHTAGWYCDTCDESFEYGP